MPFTAAAAFLAACSMAGLLPTFGFIGKELVYQATFHSKGAAAWLTAASVLAGAIFTALALLMTVRPFLGRKKATPKSPHEGSIALWVGALVLSVLGLGAGLFAQDLGEKLLAPAAASLVGQQLELDLALWHGWSPVLALSLLTSALGVTVFFLRDSVSETMQRLGLDAWPGPESAYSRALDGLNWLARVQSQILQNGYLRYYLLTLIGTTVALVALTLMARIHFDFELRWWDFHFYELALAVLILLATLMATVTSSRLGAVAALGVVGYGIALIYIFFGAPDLAMTQFLIETLVVILFVLVFYLLPRFTLLSPPRARLRDGAVALLAGGMMSVLIMFATSVQLHPPISGYFAEHSVPGAHGHNIVNVILVDFRALDTLGEITVLAVAAMGVYALLRLRLAKDKGS
jgi:multicomponent Na+:H+ antiporter subunit A